MTGINRMEDIQEGRCQCGDISYSINKSKIISTHHCHCKDCQRTTGSGKATIILCKKICELEWRAKYFESKGSSGSKEGFCSNCGSGVLSYTKELPHVLFIKAGTLDDSSRVKIDSNFYQIGK